MNYTPVRLVAAPLYRQVEEHLTRQIHDGAFPPGSRLPSDGDLCAQYGVSRITIRHALDNLIRGNLVRRQQGVGTFVIGPDQAVKKASLFGYIDDIHPHLNLKLLSAGRRVPPVTLARTMGVPAEQECQCYVSVNQAGKEPLSYIEAYFPDESARFVSAADFAGHVPSARVVEMRSGKVFAHAEQTMEAVAAPAHVANALGLAVGHPIIRMERVYFATDGSVLDATEAHYHPQRYQYAVRLVPRANTMPRQIEFP
jgi:GntR family transcriptional regulator